ncbi:MAG TPA: hypothetical protein VF033_11915 [Steroidobacteraceae bacterium]|jgi:hypothetical protein
MQHPGISADAAANDALIARYDLERQLRLARRHYEDACAAACQARDEWRALSTHPRARAADVAAVREKFRAVAARCNRLRAVIEALEDRLDV